MDIREIRALRGPNYFSWYRNIYILLDLGEFKDKPSNEIPGFVDCMKSSLPSLKDHDCSKGEEADFFERLEKGTSLAHVVEHVALELQCLAGMEVGSGETMRTEEDGVYKIAFRYRVEEAGLEAGEEAVRVVEETAEGENPDLDQVVKKLEDIRDENTFEPIIDLILSEASDRGIPYIRLNDDSYFQLGYGKNQRRIQASMTDDNSGFAVEITDDKERTEKILDESGLLATESKKRDVGKAVVDMLFPSGSDGRIPVVAVTGTNGKTTTVRLISHILREDGNKVGVSCTDGLFSNGELLIEGDYSGPQGAKSILKENNIDHAVLEVARGGILRRGLGFDESEVGVFLNVEKDHLGQEHINTIEDMARVKSVVVQSVKESGKAVLNAEDPNVLKYKDEVKADTILFSRDPDIEALEEHLSEGGTAVTVEDGKIVVKKGERVMEVVDVSDIPITHDGKAGFNVQNSIAAVASSFALDLDIDVIREGLKTFESSIDRNPGRMNIMEIDGIKVMVDYAHNRPAVEALSEILDDLTDGEKIVICQGTGNRRRQDIIDFGRGIGKTYDRVIINDADPRNRKIGETAELVKKGVLEAGVPEECIDMILDELESIDAGFKMAEEGDLLVVQPGQIQDVIAHIESKK